VHVTPHGALHVLLHALAATVIAEILPKAVNVHTDPTRLFEEMYVLERALEQPAV